MERGEKGIGEVADAGSAIRVGIGCTERRVKIFRGFRVAAELGIQVAGKELEDRIAGMTRDERLGDRQRIFVALIERAQIPREIKARIDRHKHAALGSDPHLADAILFAASGNAHEETQNLRDRRKRIHVVVVEADARRRIGHIGIELQGTETL